MPIGPNIFAMADVQISAKELIEISIREDVTEKETTLRFSDQQTNRRGKAQLTIFRLNAVQITPRADPQNCEDEFLKSLQAKKYQYGAGLMNVATPWFGKVGAIKANIMSWHCGK